MSEGLSSNSPSQADVCIPIPAPGRSGTSAVQVTAQLVPAAPQHDRFIPNRATMRLRGSAGLAAPLTAQDGSYDRLLRDQLLKRPPQEAAERDASILSFSGPLAQSPLQCGDKDLAAQMSLQMPRLWRTPPLQSQGPARSFAQAPYKVLDAPGLDDKYYTNILDWSTQNIVAVALGSSVWLWHGASERVMKLMHTPPDAVPSSLAWSARGTFLAVGAESSAVQVWDTAAGKQLRSLGGHSQRVYALAWAGPCLASGSRDRAVLLHDWSPDSVLLASGGNDNRVAIWDRRATAAPLHSLEHGAAVKALAWSPHCSGLLATGAGIADRHIRLWNTSSGRCCSALDSGSQVVGLAFSTSCNELASAHGFAGSHVSVWTAPGLSKMATLRVSTARVCHMAVSPDGHSVVTAAADELLRFFSLFPETQAVAPGVAAWSSSLGRRSHIR